MTPLTLGEATEHLPIQWAKSKGVAYPEACGALLRT